MGNWHIELHPAVETWFLRLVAEDPESADLVEKAITMLEERGPTLGRPLVDHVRRSAYHNMKELRPASAGCSEVRILFAFDPRRQAVLLVAGDKAGRWNDWYTKNIPLADQRYTEHLTTSGNHAGRA
ncbi:type II toxin-antitoxin system RelE/ParE family toxin [Actinokineospora sp. PR83]|uniref:type II toxin-antitoxin system RelE/ParE family toxin n=1 Tax=Actinokineospora sp. PR83 TaxID=2884908 RepID=UPI0027E012E7|nr:type II toxin-antitoxin system RelE/ParE family toxin [Actinokineospora sp. PR83]MCG8917469.1 type II toxin-antitoxin system RelE/ParE family toxin [Actinokineospora sp. PR83]